MTPETPDQRFLAGPFCNVVTLGRKAERAAVGSCHSDACEEITPTL